MCRCWVAAWILLIIAAHPARGEWKAPADNRFSEEQLKLYLNTAAQMSDQDSKIIAQAAKTQSYDQRMGLANQLTKANEQCLARQHISREEYDWLAKRISIAW